MKLLIVSLIAWQFVIFNIHLFLLSVFKFTKLSEKSLKGAQVRMLPTVGHMPLLLGGNGHCLSGQRVKAY